MNELDQLGEDLFISTRVTPKEVEMPDGSTPTFHFKEVPNTVVNRFLISQRSRDPEELARAALAVVVGSFCTADGKPVLTFQRASELKREVMDAFFKAALEVNTSISGKS